MTNPTPHGQVPEALRLAHIFDNPLPPEWPDMVAAAAELRRQHARIAELEAVGAGGAQALSAAPEAIAKLRHLYQNMVNGAVRDTASAKRIAEGLLAPAIEALERATPPAEQQATKETSGGFHVWRDISTAPKDGSRFVAIGYNYGLYSEGRHICVAQWFRGCWMEVSDWNEASELKYLTHWMPLPPLPGSAASATANSVTAPAGGVDDAVDAIALARYKVVPAHESMFHRFAVVAGDGKQQLYLGREVECENMARKFAGAFLDGAFYQSSIAPTPPAQAAESVLEDAARWQWLADYLIGERTDLDEGIVACATIDALRQFADAARKQGGAA